MFTPNFQFFGFGPKGAGADRRSSVEDVEYTEVRDSSDDSRTQSAPEYDKAARRKEIREAAEKQNKDLCMGDPLFEVILGGLFVSGALWADDLPEDVRSVDSTFFDALGSEADRILKNKASTDEKLGRSGGEVASLVIVMTFTSGAKWARENPPARKAQPEIDRDFRTWAGSLFWGQAGFEVDALGQIRILTHQKVFSAIRRKTAANLLAMAEEINVDGHGHLVIVISGEESKRLVKEQK